MFCSVESGDDSDDDDDGDDDGDDGDGDGDDDGDDDDDDGDNDADEPVYVTICNNMRDTPWYSNMTIYVEIQHIGTATSMLIFSQ